MVRAVVPLPPFGWTTSTRAHRIVIWGWNGGFWVALAPVGFLCTMVPTAWPTSWEPARVVGYACLAIGIVISLFGFSFRMTRTTTTLRFTWAFIPYRRYRGSTQEFKARTLDDELTEKTDTLCAEFWQPGGRVQTVYMQNGRNYETLARALRSAKERLLNLV